MTSRSDTLSIACGHVAGPPGRERWGTWAGQMAALSFCALFLEMMVIRWVPSVVTLVAYYANLLLLSSFLGLGAGALAADRRWRLFERFPLFFVAAIGSILLFRDMSVGITTQSESRFYALPGSIRNVALLAWIFAINALLFAPIGERMGQLFQRLPPLRAYGWDLVGSLAGVVCFGCFSLNFFSPVLGLAVVAVVYLVLAPGNRWLSGVAFAGALGATVWAGDRHAVWSPYHHITVEPHDRPGVTVGLPPPELRTMRNPPLYRVRVNQLGYHYDATIEPARYDATGPHADLIRRLADQYRLLYEVARGRERALVVGAGGGADVEAALWAGMQRLDAVEIDPALVAMSRRFNAGAPYDDPRVTVHIDDARAFIKRAQPGYDLVVFGFLDSQALFSSMSNVRLDGYVYTVESLRAAYALLGEKGMLALSFAVGQPWLAEKLFQMMATATGREPAMYMSGVHLLLLAPRDPAAPLPAALGPMPRAMFADAKARDLATDDWPYLYLAQRTIPGDYLLTIATLLGFSVIAIWRLGRGQFDRRSIHFGCLGLAFMLLETKAITDCTLLFGATWFVTSVVVAGVLLMVLAANLVAMRLPRFSPWLYLPLMASLLVLWMVPREYVLGWTLMARVAWVALAVPLPVFFAGLIFSTTFRQAASPAAAFGANLIGAMVGGFSEYLAMAVGSRRLMMLVITAYLGSLLVVAGPKR